MTLNDTAETAVSAIENVTGRLSQEDRSLVLDHVLSAMKEAMSACCVENDVAVKMHISHDPTLAQRISEEAEARRQALIANLGAAR